MDPSHIESLVRRLIANPQDEQALNEAFTAGEHDPPAYAGLLERVAQGTADPSYSAHWLKQAAEVWQTLGDQGRERQLIFAAAERDPSDVEVVERVAQIHREGGDGRALAALLERVTQALPPLCADQPELREPLVRAHQELATLYGDGPLAQPDGALRHWLAIVALDPNNPYAAYAAREMLKSQQRWAEAAPLFATELAVVTDPERRLALHRDEADVRRAAGDRAGACAALGRALDDRPDDVTLGYEFASAVVERIDAGEDVDAASRARACEALTRLGESYEGEHALGYAQAALKCAGGNDRAMWLAHREAERFGRESELVPAYREYARLSPQGYMAEQVRATLARLDGGGGVGGGAVMGAGAVAAEDVSQVPTAPPSASPEAQAVAAEIAALHAGGGVAPGYGYDAAAGYPASQPYRAPVAPGYDAAAEAYSAQAYPPAPAAPPISQPPEPPAPVVPAGPSPDELCAQARTESQRGRKPQAHDKYREALALQPSHPEALAFVEDFLKQRRKFNELRDVLLAAAGAPEADEETRKKQLREVAGLCEEKLRDVAGAIDAWRMLFELDRSNAEARQKLEELLEKEKRWDELAPMLEELAGAEAALEARVALEERVARIHEHERQDVAKAAEAWSRIAGLRPGDDQAVGRAVELLEKCGQIEYAVGLVTDQISIVEERPRKGALFERLAVLRLQLGDQSGAGDAFAEAAELGEKEEHLQSAAGCYAAVQRWQDAAQVLETRAQRLEGAAKAQAVAAAGDMLAHGGDVAGALARYEEAVELDPVDEQLATRVEQHYHAQGRHEDQVALLLRRAERIEDRAARVALRQRASAIQWSLGDEAGARASLELVLVDGEEAGALSTLLEMASRRGDWSEQADLLHRLAALAEGAEKLELALREADTVARGVGDVAAALERYRTVLDALDPRNRIALGAVADLELGRQEWAKGAEALEKLVEILEGEEKVDAARRVAELYEGPLADPHAALRALELVHRADPEDFDALGRMQKLSERLEDWPRVAQLLAQLIEVEGDEEEASEMTRQLAGILSERLGRGDEALGALERLADQGDAACQAAYVELGTGLGWKGLVATKLVAWNESVAGSSRADALRHAFRLFLEVERDADARTVALELARSREADALVARHLEAIAVKLHDLDALAVAHDILARDLGGAERADELVRQAEVMAQGGADALDAIHHGEQSLGAVEPDQAEGLIARLAALTQAPGHVIDLYERQVMRCKKPLDRVTALGRAAQVAAERGSLDRARDFFNAAFGGGVQEETLAALENAARAADAATGAGTLLRTLAEALAAGGQGSRDGGRTRGALLRRAALIAYRELGDVERAFAWLTDSIIAHVDDAALDALEGLGRDVGDVGRIEKSISRALEEVYDGPLVRKLLRRRADLRRATLGDRLGAAGDLKRLHDLSPADQELARELQGILAELGDHRGLIELFEDQILRGKNPHERAELARKVACLWEEEIGDAREAGDAWRRVLRMRAGDPEAQAGIERAKSGKLKKPPPVRGAASAEALTTTGSAPPLAAAPAAPGAYEGPEAAYDAAQAGYPIHAGYDAQGYDPQQHAGYDAQQQAAYDAQAAGYYDAQQQAAYDAQAAGYYDAQQQAAYDAQAAGYYDAQQQAAYDAQAAGYYDAQQQAVYDAQAAGYDAQQHAAYEAQHAGYEGQAPAEPPAQGPASPEAEPGAGPQLFGSSGEQPTAEHARAPSGAPPAGRNAKGQNADGAEEGAIDLDASDAVELIEEDGSQQR
jgi:hypothetical protein